MTAFDAHLRHRVTIRRPSLGDLDEYGHAEIEMEDLATVSALVQPERNRLGGRQVEEDATHGAGTGITDHTIFMRITEVSASDVIYAVSAGIHTGKTFEVRQVREAGGQNHHLELDCRLIDPGPVGGS